MVRYYYIPPESEADPTTPDPPPYATASYSHFHWALHILLALAFGFYWTQPTTNKIFLPIALLISELVYWFCPLHHVSSLCRFIQGTSIVSLVLSVVKPEASNLFLQIIEVILTLICQFVLWLAGVRELERGLVKAAEALKIDPSPINKKTHAEYQKKLCILRLTFLVVNSVFVFLIVFTMLNAKPWFTGDTMNANLKNLQTDVAELKENSLELNESFSGLKEDFVQMKENLKEYYRNETAILKEDFRNKNAILKEDFRTENAILKEDFRTENAILKEDFRTENAILMEKLTDVFKEDVFGFKEDISVVKDMLVQLVSKNASRCDGLSLTA